MNMYYVAVTQSIDRSTDSLHPSIGNKGQSVDCWSWIFVSMSIMNVGIILLYDTMITSDPVQLDSEASSDKSIESNNIECRK